MGTAKAHLNLTAKRRFCLNAFAEGRMLSTIDVAQQATAAGINTTSLRFEWADAPFRELRSAGFLEYAGGRDTLGRRYHRITEQGKSALAAVAT